jgi:hypothetical protein
MFKHRSIHKYTLTSPDGKTRNQIYQVLIEKGGIQIHLITDILEELTVILVITWWLHKSDSGTIGNFWSNVEV